jgi:tRNA (guanine-N7-)-methyltransferase
LINKRFFNPYVQKVKEFTGIVFDEAPLKTFITKISSPIILDIGCGNGEYLTDIAAKNPQNFYIGFERQYKEVHRTALKIKKAGLKNCIVASMDARNIPDLFDGERLLGVIVLFPDPWPKIKQRKNRLIQKKYILALVSKIQRGGSFKVKTDNDDYFMQMLQIFYDDEVRKVLEPLELSRDYHNLVKTTKEYITPFERIFLREGMLINYIVLKRL